MHWDIKPLVGIGDLRFGMTPIEVATIMGNEIKFKRQIEDGSYNEYREGGNLPVCNYYEERLRCIDIFSMNYDIRFGNILLFQEDPQIVINRLEQINGPPSVALGICYFKKIGLSLGKWINSQTLAVKAKPKRKEDLRSVSISSKRAHFDLFPDSKTISLSKS